MILNKSNADDFNFWYMAMNFPITNWMATSIGLTPFSDVGYDLQLNGYLENTGNYYNRYYGYGSLSKVYWGFAIDPVKNISVGANF